MYWYKPWCELRSRILLSAAAITAACGFAVWMEGLRGHSSLSYAHYLWSQIYDGMMPPLFVLLATGLGGLLQERAQSTVGFTLALPVSRVRVTILRAAMGYVGVLLMSLMPALLLPLVFDADIIYRYQKSGSDVAHNTPDIFEGWVAQELKEAIDPEHAEPQIRASLLKMSIEDPTFMSENLVRQLLIRLSPLHYGGFFNVNYVSSSDVPGYPLTSMSDVIDKTENVPDHIFEVKDDIPPTLSTPPVLWMLAESGIANKNYQARLEAKGITTIPKSLMNDSEYDVIKWGIEPSTVFGANSLFAISRLALKGVGPVARMFDVASVIVVGDTMADFCLHYALSRMQGRALWMPSWFIPKDDDPYPSRMIKAIRIMEDMGRREHSRSFDVISTSVEAEKLDSLAERMKQHIQMVKFERKDTGDVSYVRTLVGNPLRWYVAKHVERITTHMLLNDELPGTFESPVPTAFAEVDPVHHRWLVELTFSNNLTPRHPALGGHLVKGANVGESRAAIDGATYTCPGAGVFGSDIEFQILRPSITVPDAERIFRIAFDNFGYECKVSDKGAYGQPAIDKFGRLEPIAKALRGETSAALLRKFRDTKAPSDDVHDDGDYLRDKRRYLNFECITKILGDDTAAASTIDDYISKGIFYRGLVLHCKRCDDTSWFSVDEIGQTFTCRRCGTNQQYVLSSWRYPNEPSWYYKLDEIVYQMLSHDGDVPILALDAMRTQSKDSFLYSPELAIRKKDTEKWEMEIDICCIANGRMYIGEAKSNDSLKSDTKSPLKAVGKYRHFSEELGATGVIFATSQPAWDDVSEKAITETFAKYPHLIVRNLTQTDLLKR
jgi:hypothetical protein